MSDLISRQDAIDALMKEFKRVPTVAIRAKTVIGLLPSAQPEQKAGKTMRLIDADALTEEVNRLPAADIKNINGQAYVLVRLSQVFNVIKTQPTVDPVKHGRWIGTEFDGYADGNPVYYEWKCSACGCVVEDEEPTWNCCPNCGCKMDAFAKDTDVPDKNVGKMDGDKNE